jgi:hypothetical protein
MANKNTTRPKGPTALPESPGRARLRARRDFFLEHSGAPRAEAEPLSLSAAVLEREIERVARDVVDGSLPALSSELRAVLARLELGAGR